jgi:ribonucleoside-diphosphate reductase alpha chain
LKFENVVKRTGQAEPFNAEKVNKVVEWACEGLDVCASSVLMSAAAKVDKLPSTSEIHDALIRAANDLVDFNNPDYGRVAARLKIFQMRKQAFGEFLPPNLYDHIVQLTELGKYDKHILEDYSKKEIDFLEEFLIHERDLEYAYPAVVQWAEKYLVQDRVTKKLYESPQIAIMLIAMCLHASEPTDKRMSYVLDFYDEASNNRVSLPTPIMGGVRTPTRQFSSCCLIEAGDSLKSINATATAIVEYISKRAGVGINGGAIRALGTPIRGGEASHTGVVPFYKYFASAVKSCSQGALRGGSATLFYPMWHLEVENILVLKNNRGTEDNRVRNLDYGIQLSGLFYKRLVNAGNITLFSPDVAEGELYKLFFEDEEKFTSLYETLELDPNVKKKTISAMELFLALATERAQTARIYIQNVDNCTKQGVFIPEAAPVRQSNLCLEILLPTEPMGTPDEEIALCTLAAVNLGLIETPEQFMKAARVLVRALDNLLDYQDYAVPAALKNKQRRTLGVGAINFAYALAKRGLRYADAGAKEYTHKTFETLQYSLLKASNELAIEKGECELFHHTKYSQGLMPVDNYNKNVDNLYAPKYLHDWVSLAESIVEHGLRNSTLTALMPSETSSQISNATNGIEPPRSPITTKGSKDGVYRQVVPEVETLMYAYDYAWEMKDNRGYIDLVAIMQKFVDQAISANTYYRPSNYPNNMVPAQVMLADLIYAYKHGVKTWYYHNTYDGGNADGNIEEEDCESGACKI